MIYTRDLGEYWSLIDTKEYKNFTATASGAVAVNQNEGVAYIFGGFTSDGQTPNILYSFNMEKNTLDVIDSLNIDGRLNHRMFLIENNSKICIIGGVKNINDNERPQFCDDLVIYDLKNKEIQKSFSFEGKMKRGQLGATYDDINNEIYVYGGSNTNDFF